MAERAGFEPAVRSLGRLVSSELTSTTHPSLHQHNMKTLLGFTSKSDAHMYNNLLLYCNTKEIKKSTILKLYHTHYHTMPSYL